MATRAPYHVGVSTLPQSPRLRFRRWSEADIDLATNLWANPAVMRFLGGPYTPTQIEQRLHREIDHQRQFGFQYWPIFLKADGAHVGVCGLKPYKADLREYEIGFHLLPQFWGAGYASEAARATIAFAFESIGAMALYAGHHPQNASSRALVQRLGFECLGTHYFSPTGLQHPWYRLTAA